MARCPQPSRTALKGMYDLFSVEAHTNHLTVSYVRFRSPAGYNFYLSGCYNPNVMVGIHTTCLGLLLDHLDKMCEWYQANVAFADMCPPSTIESLHNELAKVTEQLETQAEHAQHEIEGALGTAGSDEDDKGAPR